MANITHKMTLSTTEPNNDVGLIKVRQADDETQIFDVEIIENGVTKPFVGLTPFFCLMAREVTGQGVSEEPVTVFDGANGVLRYTVSANAMQMVGKNEAYFSFRKELKNGKWAEQFSTRSFQYTVEKSIYTQPFQDSNYWFTFKELYRLFNEYMESGKGSWEDFIDQNKEIIESIDPGGKVLSYLGIMANFREWDESLILKMSNEFQERGVNVKWFGAVGDGETDDTIAIQAALSLAKNNPDVVKVVIPPGTYKVTDTLSVYGETTIDANGAVIMRHHEKHILMNGDIGDEFMGYNGNSDITILGGTWDGNVTEYHSAGFAGLCFIHCQNIVLDGCIVKDIMSAHAIDLAGVKNCEIKNVKCLGYMLHTNPASQRDYSEAIQIEVCVEAGWDVFGLHDGTPCQDIRIINFDCGPSGTEGTTAWMAGVGHHGAVAGVYTEKISITNTVFKDQTFGGVRAFKWRDVTIKDCKFFNCGKGVIFDIAQANSSNSKDIAGVQTGTAEAGSNAVIENCVFEGNMDTPIYALGSSNNDALVDGIKVVNCDFRNSNAVLYFKYARNISFSNCRFRDFTVGMITLALVDGFIFDNCRAESITKHAIRASGSDTERILKNIFINKNTFSDVSEHILTASNAENLFVGNNTVVNSSTGDTVDAFNIWGASNKGKIFDNVILNAQSTKGRTGVFLTTACTDISVTNNTVIGYTNETYIPGGVPSLYAGQLTALRDGNTVYPDTNWQAPAIASGVSLVSGATNRCRRVGNICEINTRVKGVAGTYTDLVTVPAEIAPSASIVSTIVSNSNKTARVVVYTDGKITLANVTAGNNFDAADEWYVSLNWLYD